MEVVPVATWSSNRKPSSPLGRIEIESPFASQLSYQPTLSGPYTNPALVALIPALTSLVCKNTALSHPLRWKNCGLATRTCCSFRFLLPDFDKEVWASFLQTDLVKSPTGTRYILDRIISVSFKTRWNSGPCSDRIVQHRRKGWILNTHTCDNIKCHNVYLVIGDLNASLV